MTRILFVDNDPDFIETRSEFLKKAGYQVVRATSLAEAERCLREIWTPIAILDIRLENDDDEKDASGLMLVNADFARSVTKIILTNFKTPLARDLVRAGQRGRPLAIDIVEKQEGPDTLLRVIHETLTYHVHINFILTIDWQATNPFALVSRIEPGAENERERLMNRTEELEDLFRRLFYEKDRIRIDRLLWQHDRRVALTVFAFKGAMMDPFIVVCGENSHVVDESLRFDRFAPKALGETSTTLADKAETTHFAANAYSLAQIDLEMISSLGDVYRTGDKKVFADAIQMLFTKTLPAWEGLPTPRERKLEDLYLERLSLTADRISPQAIHLRWEALVRYFPELKKIIPILEPVIALLHSTISTQSTLTVKSPGALTGDNILIDENNRVWLTDFANAGDVPQLWNFVTLESTIRFDWGIVPYAQNFRENREQYLKCLGKIEECLLDDVHFGNPDTQLIEVPAVRQLVRSFIQPIRKLAKSRVGSEYFGYHLGIFFQATRRFANFEPTVPLTPNEQARLAHVLIAMTRIAERIRNTDIVVTPKGERGLRIDKANQAVYLNGKRVNYTPQEFKLLEYLYDHANQLCKRQELLLVIGTNYGEGYIDTLIGRLRNGIESDKSHPCYIVTERGRGYRLALQTDDER